MCHYYRPYCNSVHHRLKPLNQDDVDFIKGIIKSEKIFRVTSLLIVFHQDSRGDYHDSTLSETRINDHVLFQEEGRQEYGTRNNLAAS